MTVHQEDDGTFYVLDARGQFVRGGFATNAEAWRWLDRQSGDPVSPSENRHQYGWDRYVEEGWGN